MAELSARHVSLRYARLPRPTTMSSLTSQCRQWHEQSDDVVFELSAPPLVEAGRRGSGSMAPRYLFCAGGRVSKIDQPVSARHRRGAGFGGP